MKHSILPPSSAARRMECPGSRILEQKALAKKPPARLDEAVEGDTAHWVAARRLKNIISTIGEIAENGELVTEEMVEGAELYFNELWFYANGINYQAHIEKKIQIPNINEHCFGTPDFFAIPKIEGKSFIIADYKFGHKVVDSFENWQLIEYASGIIPDGTPATATVVFIIVQPRNYISNKISIWETTLEELFPYFARLKESEMISLDETKAMCNPTVQCTNCLGRASCAVLENAALAIADSQNLAVLNFQELNPHQLGNELKILKQMQVLLNARVSGLEEEAKFNLLKGNRVPHFELQNTYSRERWTTSSTGILNLGDMMGVDLGKPREVITPKQAIKAGLDETLVKQYSETVSTGFKLVELNKKKIQKIFDQS